MPPPLSVAICLVLLCGMASGLHAQSIPMQAIASTETATPAPTALPISIAAPAETATPPPPIPMEAASTTPPASTPKEQQQAEWAAASTAAQQLTSEVLFLVESEDDIRQLRRISGFRPGTRVRVLSKNGDTFRVTDGATEFNVSRGNVTDDVDEAILQARMDGASEAFEVDKQAAVRAKQQREAEDKQLIGQMDKVRAEMQRLRAKVQEQAAEIQQRIRVEPQQQHQAEVQTIVKSTPSVSKEGMPEHTYELLQDHTIVIGGLRIRLRRGEQYHGRILVDHAEIDINGISYPVPSGILSAPKD